MKISKLFFVPVLSILGLFIFSTPIFAGGGNAYINVTESGDPHWMTVTAYVNPTNVNCQGMVAAFNFSNPEDGDMVSGSNGDNTSTAGNAAYVTINGQQYLRCSVYAKVYAKNFEMNRPFRVSFKGSNINEYRDIAVSFDQYYYPNNLVLLPWEGIPTVSPVPTPQPVPTTQPSLQPVPSPVTVAAAPDMIYPLDGQTLDLEGAYMFKVTTRSDASGYLFGLFQDNVMVYENYRDTGLLSTNGEFALWENNPVHAKFHAGQLKVMIRSLVNNNWSNARTIYINLQPRANQNVVTQVVSTQPTYVGPINQSVNQPVNQPVRVEATESNKLQQQISVLQQELNDSKAKQASLENTLNRITNWIKSIFPFFK